MGRLGRSVTHTSTTRLSDGGKRVTKYYDDGSSEDWNYDRYGQLTGVDCHDRHGESHSHNVNRGVFGPSKGPRR